MGGFEWLMLVMLGLGTLGAGALMWRSILIERRRHQAGWQTIAASLSLTLKEADLKPILAGVIDGHEVSVTLGVDRLEGDAIDGLVLVSVRPSVPLPTGLELSTEASLRPAKDVVVADRQSMGNWRVRADHADDAVSWLERSEAQKAALSLRRIDGISGFSEGSVRCERLDTSTAATELMIEQAIESCRGFVAARLAPWHELRDSGLDLEVNQERARAAGSSRGVPVTVAAVWAEGCTTIEVPFDPPLQAGLLIQRGQGDLGDPVLDRMIEASGWTKEELRALLVDADLQDDVLALVHGHPGTRVTSDGVEVRVAGASPSGLVELVEAAVRVATVVQRGRGGVEAATNLLSQTEGAH